MQTQENTPAYTPADFKSDQAVRWCPGCGDHAILNTLHKAMAEVGVPPYRTAVISGIGCKEKSKWRISELFGFNFYNI